MTEALRTLAAWLSPGYPTGAYAYSHGLEAAVAEGAVDDAASFAAWLDTVLRHGAGRSDAILMAAAWRAADDAATLRRVAELAEALAPSAERHLETLAQGRAFAAATREAWGVPVADAPWPVALGAAARLAGCPLSEALSLALQAFAANLVFAAVRLVPLGQTEGQRLLAAAGPAIAAVAAEAEGADPDDIGSAAFAADLHAIAHETLPVRLFRS